MLGALMGPLGCQQDISGTEDALGDTVERVERNVLPVVIDESEVVLRNLVNLLALFPEICATPLGELGDFQSALPELQRAQQQVGDIFTFDEDSGSWEAVWRNVVLGDADGVRTVDTAVPSVDVTLRLRFRNEGFATLEAVPFALVPDSAVKTARTPPTPPTCAAEAREGFFLFQDAETGVWTLSWCARETAKLFMGEVSAPAVSRVLRRASDEAGNMVSNISVNAAENEVFFNEITAPGDDKGFRFYVRPGALVRFRLSLGPAGGAASAITREQLFLGNGDRVLPPDLNPEEFELASSLPLLTTTMPAFTTGVDLGTFIWQDVANNECPSAQQAQWRMRFSTPVLTIFSGSVRASNADDDADISVVPVSACPVNSIEVNDDDFEYTCGLQGTTPSGYDICTRDARRVIFVPEIEEVRTPSLIAIGATGGRPPAADPFTILFDLDIEERQSRRELSFSDAVIILQGTTEEEGSVSLRPEQVSREPLCHAPVASDQLRLLLTGEGEYATTRFEGSRYELDEVQFTAAGETFEVGVQRLPTRGDVMLRTRTEDDLQNNVEITVPMPDIAEVGTQIISLIDVEMQFDNLELDFLDRPAVLTVE